ncbi:MAG: polyphosphate polymerase domain-containing protein [Lachnospiraceae bacterium]|nr:polyphosphate polymerase domain-containing protein [Lachnospiraceae bacterium]
MAKEITYRHELKYLMNKRDADCCLPILRQFTKNDVHAPQGEYFVRSLYFDDEYRSAYEDKLSGVASRRKYRIRIYDMDDGFISLEKKIKEGSYIRKESAVISRTEYDMIINGETGFLLERDEKVAKEFAIECRMNRLKPEVIVDYMRKPLVCEYGGVRITFDMNIKAVFDSLDIFETDSAAYNVLEQDLLIMEVKYNEYLPDVFHAILPDTSCQIAASKYVMCEDVLSSFR